ncbi:hypothetical protein [Lutibacter sp.]
MSKLAPIANISGKRLFRLIPFIDKFIHKNNSKRSYQNYAEMVDNFYLKIKKN